MATGDMSNNAAKVRKQLVAIRYPHDIAASVETLARGNAADHLAELLRILHYALLDHSRHVAELVQSADLDLYGKTDVKFVDGVLRFARDTFAYFPHLTTSQLLSPQHFRERKLIVVADLLAHVAQAHAEASRRRKQQQAVWIPPSHKPSFHRSGDLPRVPSHHVTPAQVDGTSSPWISMNLGQPKAARVVRHTRTTQRPSNGVAVHVSDALPTAPLHEVQTHSILDWNTPIEDVPSHAALDKDILNPHRSPDRIKRNMWFYSNQHDADEEDMYPRASMNIQRAPSIDIPTPPKPVPVASASPRVPPNGHSSPPSPPVTLDAVLSALSKLEEVVAAKMDTLTHAFEAKFAALDDRVARLESVQVTRTTTSPSSLTSIPQVSPNQQDDPPPRVKLSTFIAQSTQAQYKWPPEPSVFGQYPSVSQP
ncbi:hypothetical protein AaE_007157 [Aphanomyces astaci]|uniref:Centrosomal protein of 44 kDa n=1 Tax=Aphanomyces astaci TaxID=112090 RepID=A0A6A5AB74_APHAT|nr:hypothetical protein AaE_007157 [Aphanomyces astaci]